jgi:TolB-like protein
MDTYKVNIFSLALTLLVMCLAVTTFAAGIEPGANQADSAAKPLRLAVIPLANYSGLAEATDLIMPAISGKLAENGFVLAVSADMDKSLRKYRIRSTSAIGTTDAQNLAHDLDVDYLLLGSVDLFLPGDIPEVAFSVRLIDISDMSVLWANSVAASGRDYVKLLGVGLVDSMKVLIARLVTDQFAGFDPDSVRKLAANNERKTSGCVVVVAFDNLSQEKFGGDIITAIVLSELTAGHQRLLEPGAAMELFRRNSRFPKGEIDRDLLGQLHEQFGVDRVVTGALDRFQAAPGDAPSAVPEIQLGGRCIDAATGRVLAAWETERVGDQSEKLFKLGTVHSLGKLARQATHTLLERLNILEK